MRRITFLLATLLLLGACKEAKKASDMEHTTISTRDRLKP